jgi:hypothetical protein
VRYASHSIDAFHAYRFRANEEMPSIVPIALQISEEQQQVINKIAASVARNTEWSKSGDRRTLVLTNAAYNVIVYLGHDAMKTRMREEHRENAYCKFPLSTP